MAKKVEKDKQLIDKLNEPLAIIGMNCQFPGVDSDVEDVEAFYQMLIKGQTPIKEVPKHRWNIDEYYDADRKKEDKIITRHGGFLNDIGLFDADFFKTAAAEAKHIDPQQRLFLEVAIRALNHANITLNSLDGSNTGVYYAASTQEYSQLNIKDNITFNEYTQIGVAHSAAPGRLCHFLNLTGPSMAVDTACSSSLSALYLAAIALRTQQCHMAIVGGTHLNLCPENLIGLSKTNMLSAVGECRSFSSNADGYVRSEGCAVLIVKRLSDAIKDHNRIHALIKSIVMNQDGEGTSLVAPNIKAQIAMHEQALRQADLVASDVDYIETHGTGTPVGDSVEFQAIQSVHQGQHSKNKPLVIGALKTNLGHTIAASGLASVIKAISALQHECIPPNLHYSTPNPLIDPESIPAFFPVRAMPFTRQNNKKRVVQVVNFGFSGTNVSTIIEEPENVQANSLIEEDTRPQCFVISAKTEYSLKQMIANYPHYLKQSSAGLRDICMTLINCRDHYKFRVAIIANDKEELIKKIQFKDYVLKKVAIKKARVNIVNNVNQIYEDYLSGFNIKLEVEDTQYQKVDLPLYYFDRKTYWHEPRINTNNCDWRAALYQQPKEQQIETIKNKLALHLQTLLNKKTIEAHQDFGSLGLSKELLKVFEEILSNMCSRKYKLSSSPRVTLDSLARHIHQLIMPTWVCRQPTINVLNLEPIAIIGMSCRLPKASTVDEFLSLLERGDNGMIDIPLDRWDNSKYYDPDVDALGRLYIKQLGLIENIRNFDADFFNISPREAKFMAPQLRVFMETSYHALEDANLSLESIKDSNTGVFVGCGTNEYGQLLAKQGIGLEEMSIYFPTGNVLNALAGRVAYVFDFHGPIQAIDTACSSSMTAIHNACLSLQSGDCTMALAGGVNILLLPDSNVVLSRSRMLSPESRCKTFSEDADGYARSEGCGVVVLKLLSAAIRDQDNILAVIKGASINSDGKSAGFTVPNGTAQEEVIRSALAKAHLSPADIDYIEVHGTGTPLADPIEVNTLTKIFSEYHSQEKPLYIGSVKTNIGHCESASGVAGLIKVVLSLQTHKLFKHLNFKKLNPAIELNNTLIPLTKLDWHKEGLRSAGVSSFGFSGANAHIVLQEAPLRKKSVRVLPKECLLVLSAKKKVALELLLSSYQKFLANTKEAFADVCYTAATCRSHFPFRVAIKASSSEEAAALIANKAYVICHIKKEQNSVVFPLTLEQVQVAYQDGLLINWSDFYKSLGNKFAKVKLPLYEFVREEYWFGDTGKLKEVLLPQDWCFQLEWQNQLSNKNNPKTPAVGWLLVGAKPLASALRAQGLHIACEEDNYPLDKLQGVIFAASLEWSSLTSMDAQIDLSINLIKKLLNLVKQLNHQSIKLQLIVVTRQGIAELAYQGLNLSHSSLLGFCKTLVLELPQFNTILIDGDEANDEMFSSQILDEIHYNHGLSYEHLVAYREGKRLVPRLKKTTLIEKKPSLHGQGRYLITGGCGGLGLVTAQALLSAGARELILTARNVNKPAVISAVKKIQAAYPGRSIRMIGLDITDKEKLASLLLELNKDALLKGIIHAAGMAVKAPLIEHQEEQVDALFAAKVKGGWYLHELSQNFELDFFIVYSSIASIFGSNKESVYSGANSFLDALIAERHRLGLVGTAIQWGPWGEVGMASTRARHQGLKQALISNEQGYALLKVLIHGQMSQITVISPDYLKFMLDFVPKPMPAFHHYLAEDLNGKQQLNTKTSSWLGHYPQINQDKRFKACKDMLSAACKEVLELSFSEDLDEEEGFFELGFDSLMITELAAKLNEKLEPYLKLTATIGFNYPSINKLAHYIEFELDGYLSQSQLSKASTVPANEAIAIIGMSFNLPNAADTSAFVRLLEEGGSGIKDIPRERWDNRKYYDPDKDAPGKSYVNKLGLIENIKDFDASFFGISPREAKLMEPQQRIFLECCYKALEHANYPPESLRGGLVGVFAGVGPNEYYLQLDKSVFSTEELGKYFVTGNVSNLIPGRVAYTFDFRGPSISFDTACSSSLVAIHYACRSLIARETNYALAGGVNVLLMPESNINLCKARALSPEGKCKTFDEDADGYVRGEGCGVVFLKRLADALEDKDHILAVIKASAVNNDGKSAGLTVPNGKSQEEVMLQALSYSQLSSTDISYVEAHGTGTPLGDPIEVHAINKVYGTGRSKDNPLYIGTVKTNIGHLESASGVASVIKMVISLQQKKIYKLLHFNKLNPHIKIDDTRIALQNMHWSSDRTRRRAGINAFGFSGTNAHLILEEFPQEIKQRLSSATRTHVLVLSAKSKIALEHLIRSYQAYLATSKANYADICFTAAHCRDHYTYRFALAAKSLAEASLFLARGQYALSYENNKSLDLQNEPVLNSLVTDYLRGEKVDWSLYYKSFADEFIKVILPHYSFERSEFWPDNKADGVMNLQAMHPLLGQMFSMPGDEYLFTNKLDLERLTYIKQHVLFEKMIFPATAHIESGLAAAKAVLKSKAFLIKHFEIERPLYPKQNQDVQLQVKPNNEQGYQINLFAKQEDTWQLFSTMELQLLPILTPESVDMNLLKSFFGEPVDVSKIYESFKTRSLFYGNEFQVIQEGYVKSDSVLCKIVLTKTGQGLGYYYHPVLLDGAMQSMLLLSTDNYDTSVYVPYAFAGMRVFQEAPKSIWVHLTKHAVAHPQELWVDIKLYDNSGLLIADMEALKLRRVTRSHFMAYESNLQHLYYSQWNLINRNLATQLELPELWVIAKNALKAEKLLGKSSYQLVGDFNELVPIENKNILFFYEQEAFYELVHCCQILFKFLPKSFILVTENAYAIHDKDRVNPYHTMASSFWKSFRNELELSNNYTIDLGANTTSLLPVLNQLFITPGCENQFALREELLYVPRLKKKKLSFKHAEVEALPLTTAASLGTSLFNPNATYLITGGTGGLAQPLIDYLIRSGVKHIAISSRSACSAKIKALIESTSHQQVVLRHYQADASNYQQMEQLIEELHQGAYPLKGLFHLAGVVHDGLIVNLSDEDIQRVLTAKMESALILHQLTKNSPLDLFVLFSSTASLLGARGQANYVAANGFLDGLAHLRHQLGLPALAINWGPFHTIGMTAKLTQALKQHGFIPLDKASIDMLDLLLKCQLTQIALCPIDWNIYFKHSPKQIECSDLLKTSLPADQYFLNALRQHSKQDCIKILTQALCEISAEVLGLDEVTETDNLFSMGLDSLMSIEIRNRIHDKLYCPNLNLSIEHFINAPRIDKIAHYIADELEPIIENQPAEIGLTEKTIEEVALCDFQYIFWVFNKFGYSFNIGMQLELHGKLNKEYVEQAFDFVVKNNSSFWINFDRNVPIQKLNKQGQFKLIYQDISLDNQENELNNAFYKNMMHLIPLEKSPLIRVYLYKINNDLHELHLLIPHIIADDTSCELVFNQFKQSYEALSLGKKLIKAAAQDSYLNYVKFHNLHYAKNLKDKIDFWNNYNKEVQQLYFGQQYHLPDAATKQTKNLFHYPLATDLVAGFIDWHKQKNINISTGLLAVCQIVFAKMSHQKTIPILLIHSGREGSRYKDSVGLFSQYKRINTSLKESSKFIDFIHSIEEELLKTAPYQSCSHFIKDSGLKGSRLSMSQYLLNKFKKIVHTKYFKESNLNSRIINYYLNYFTKTAVSRKIFLIKYKLNKLFHWNIPLQKPDRLRTIISITPSFFSKEVTHRSFANLNYRFASHFGCADRPIGNSTLWIYFSKNQYGEYQLSINGPLTTDCKDQIARDFNKFIAKFLENEEQQLADLMI